jgi:profilin
MSWQSYVDDQLVGAGFKDGAILGHDGNPWAVSPGLGLKAGEGAKLANTFKNPADVFASGITVGGVKYMGIKGDDRSIYGKKGAGGIVTVKTGQAIVVGVYDEKFQPGPAANTAEKLADYLIENGY